MFISPPTVLEVTEDSKDRKDERETPDIGPKMQYLSLTNEERNQYTTTSITSNLALYEVRYLPQTLEPLMKDTLKKGHSDAPTHTVAIHCCLQKKEMCPLFRGSTL